MRIAVDAMGGDHAPIEVVRGAVQATRDFGTPIILVGDRVAIEREVAECPADTSLIEVKHTSQVVGMEEPPTNCIRRKPDSSIVVAANLVKSGEAHALVSAGNTGAVMAVATIRLGRIPGIDRPAIGSLIPTMNGRAVVLDAGANVDCSVGNLLQFAVMGNEYAAHVLKVGRPRIGLLSIGEEDSKGDELTKATNAELARSDLNFIGNVEGKEVFRGRADVVVCDGFAGNILLKVGEGVGEFLLATLADQANRSWLRRLGAVLMRPALRALSAKLDYAEYGGAPLLGVNGVCVIGHGRSSARAIRNAIRAAADAVQNDVVGYITASVRRAPGTVS